MVTGEIKNKIDQIWDTFFVAGITNPITVLEQMTYIFSATTTTTSPSTSTRR